MENLDAWVFSMHPPTIGEVIDMRNAQEGDLQALVRWVAERYRRPLAQVRVLSIPEITILLTRAVAQMEALFHERSTPTPGLDEVTMQRQLQQWKQQLEQTND
jgi:hypothetical protein